MHSAATEEAASGSIVSSSDDDDDKPLGVALRQRYKLRTADSVTPASEDNGRLACNGGAERPLAEHIMSRQRRFGMHANSAAKNPALQAPDSTELAAPPPEKVDSKNISGIDEDFNSSPADSRDHRHEVPVETSLPESPLQKQGGLFAELAAIDSSPKDEAAQPIMERQGDESKHICPPYIMRKVEGPHWETFETQPQDGNDLSPEPVLSLRPASGIQTTAIDKDASARDPVSVRILSDIGPGHLIEQTLHRAHCSSQPVTGEESCRAVSAEAQQVPACTRGICKNLETDQVIYPALSDPMPCSQEKRSSSSQGQLEQNSTSSAKKVASDKRVMIATSTEKDHLDGKYAKIEAESSMESLNSLARIGPQADAPSAAEARILCTALEKRDQADEDIHQKLALRESAADTVNEFQDQDMMLAHGITEKQVQTPCLANSSGFEKLIEPAVLNLEDTEAHFSTESSEKSAKVRPGEKLDYIIPDSEEED